MALSVAVQMDPIERINIRGDSTFALLLEAERRGHRLGYDTPAMLAQQDGRVFATVRPVSVREIAAYHTQGNSAFIRYYTVSSTGTVTQTTLFTEEGTEAQSLLPHIAGSLVRFSSRAP